MTFSLDLAILQTIVGTFFVELQYTLRIASGENIKVSVSSPFIKWCPFSVMGSGSVMCVCVFADCVMVWSFHSSWITSVWFINGTPALPRWWPLVDSLHLLTAWDKDFTVNREHEEPSDDLWLLGQGFLTHLNIKLKPLNAELWGKDIDTCITRWVQWKHLNNAGCLELLSQTGDRITVH